MDNSFGEDTCRWMLASHEASPVRIRNRPFSSLQRRIFSKPRPVLEGCISQSFRQYFALYTISSILSAMFAWFAWCFCLQPTHLSLLFLRSTRLGNGTLPVQVVLLGKYFHLEQNVAVVLHQITQLTVFPFVEFAKPLTMLWSPQAVFLVYHP